MSSRQQRTSCSRVRNTSGPMKPATSLRCTHGAACRPARSCAAATSRRQRAREAVLARLVHHHVEALAVPVGDIGPLAGLEVEAVPAGARGGVVAHLLDR